MKEQRFEKVVEHTEVSRQYRTNARISFLWLIIGIFLLKFIYLEVWMREIIIFSTAALFIFFLVELKEMRRNAKIYWRQIK